MKKSILFTLVFISILVLFQSCNFSYNKSDTSNDTWTDTIDAPEIDVKYLEDFVNFENSGQLLSYFGEENIANDIRYLAEGSEKYLVTIVYPEQRNQIIVYWEPKSEDYKDFAFVESVYSQFNEDYQDVFKEGEAFPSKSGLMVGNSIRELEDANNGQFNFYGFGWDYSGLVTDLNSKFDSYIVRLDSPTDAFARKWSDEYGDLLGDTKFNSSDDKVKKVPLQIISITYKGN